MPAVAVAPRPDRSPIATGRSLALGALLLTAASLTLAGAALAQPAIPDPQPPTPDPSTLGAVSRALGASGAHIPISAAGTTGCVQRAIHCKQTVFSTIDATDCATTDRATFFELWTFDGNPGQVVTLDMVSNQLDPFLKLLDVRGEVFSDNDDGGTQLGAQITTTLNEGGEWTVAASGLPNLSQTGSYSLTLTCEPTLTPPTVTCSEDPNTLCLSDDRFQVQAEFRTADGLSGVAASRPLADDTGVFWFFNPDNLEMMVKVINGCSVNDRFWVFAGGLTNVEVSFFVTDTRGGNQTRIYSNPLGFPFQPIQDTNAFATCP